MALNSKKNYKIQKKNDIFFLIETKENRVIAYSERHNALETLFKKLKKGSGFNGFTPSFFKEISL